MRALLVAVVLAPSAACAAIVGLEDKQLEPDVDAGNADGASGAPSDGASSAEALDAAASVVASGQDKPWGVAVDEAFVYWTNEGAGTVMRGARVGGSTPGTVIARDQAEPHEVLVDTTNVIWRNANLAGRDAVDGGGEVPLLVRIAKATIGTPVEPTAIATGRRADQVRDIAMAADPDTFVFTTRRDQIRRHRRDSAQNAREMQGALGDKDPTHVAVDGTYAYWFLQQPLELWRAGKRSEEIAPDAGADPAKIATLPNVEIADMAADGSAVYLVTKGGAVLKVNAPDGPSYTQVVAGRALVRSLALDADHLYFTRTSADDEPGSGEVVMLPKTGGAEKVLLSGLSRPRGLAVHVGLDQKRSLYVACYGDGTIRAVAVP